MSIKNSDDIFSDIFVVMSISIFGKARKLHFVGAFDGHKIFPAIVGKKSAHQKRPRNAKEPGQNSTFVGAFGKWALKIPAIVSP